MAALTPIANSQGYAVMGSLRQEVAKFTSISNGDTYTSQLSIIAAFSADAGISSQTIGATWVNGTGGAGAVVTFACTGACTNVSWAAAGY